MLSHCPNSHPLPHLSPIVIHHLWLMNISKRGRKHFTIPGFKSRLPPPVLTYEYSWTIRISNEGSAISETSTDFLPIWIVAFVKKSLHPCGLSSGACEFKSQSVRDGILSLPSNSLTHAHLSAQVGGRGWIGLSCKCVMLVLAFTFSSWELWYDGEVGRNW